jgi:hypothetical protein
VYSIKKLVERMLSETNMCYRTDMTCGSIPDIDVIEKNVLALMDNTSFPEMRSIMLNGCYEDVEEVIKSLM